MQQQSLEWNEKLLWQPHLFLSAESMNKWFIETFPWMEGLEKETPIPVGGEKYFYIRPFDGNKITPVFMYGFQTSFKKRQSLDTWHGSKRGVVYFDGIVNIPILADKQTTWMSLTPMEIFSQRQAVGRAKGTVIMGGLGMGWLALRVLEKSKVKHLTVIEKDSAVADFFGKHLKEKFGDKINIIVGDVYNHNPLEYDSAIYDIWMNAGDCSYDNRFLLAAGHHKNCWGWGTGWRNEVIKDVSSLRHESERDIQFAKVMGLL